MATIEVSTPGLSVTQGPKVIFESNFSNDDSYIKIGGGLWDESNVPTGFQGAAGTATGSMMGVPGAGDGGTTAMRFTYDGNFTQPTQHILRHLTGQTNTGYPELYIRYNLKLPPNFRIDDGSVSGTNTSGPWKWGRLWQNTAMPPRPGGNSPGSWTENRQDAYYIVWNWSGSETNGIGMNISYGANATANGGLIIGPRARENGSAEGPRRREGTLSGAVAPHTGNLGYWQNVGGGAWELTPWAPNGADLVDKAGQIYHTFEFRWRAATSDIANDGIMQWWIDGIEQNVTPFPSFGSNPITQGFQKVGDIVDISNSNPAVIELLDNRDGFVTGDTIRITGVANPMGAAVNGSGQTITQGIDDTHWELDGIDTTGVGAYVFTSGDQMDLALPNDHFTGIPTAANPGWNALVIFDNIQGFQGDWANPAVDNYIDLSDVVISESRIGHTTQVGGVPGYIPTDDGSGFPL